MKKILSTLMLLLLVAAPISAHPPQTIEGDLDPETNTAEINIVHTAGESSTHYIEEVVIYLDEEKIITQKITKQLGDEQTFYYFIPDADPGDELKAVATCNISGQNEVTFTVSQME